MIDKMLRRGELADYIERRHGFKATLAGLDEWRRESPLPMPCAASLVDIWFTEQVAKKATTPQPRKDA